MTRQETSLLDYDEVLKYLGQFGRFQKKIFFLLWLTSAASGLAVVTFIFTGYEPNYRARVPLCEGENALYHHIVNGTERLPFFLQNLTNTVGDPVTLKSQDCRALFPLQDERGRCIGAVLHENSTVAKEHVVIDRSVITYSLIEEFNMICDRKNRVPIFSAIYMGGMLIGSYVFGFISDYFGRRPALLSSTLCVAIAGTLGGLCSGEHSANWFGLFRLLTGVGGIGMFMVSFVLAVEHVGAKFTMLFGILIEVPFALGELLLGLEAYFVRTWNYLQFVAHVPIFALVGVWYFVPESVRWLIQKRRAHDANILIKKIAKENNRECPEHLFAMNQTPISNTELLEISANGTSTEAENKEEDEKKFTILSKDGMIMAGRTINMCFQWFAVTMCYYGLSFAATSIPGDQFQNYYICTIIEIPAYFFCCMVMDCWGRRPILSFCQAISGISCIVCGVIDKYDDLGGLRVMLFMIGKFGAAASFAIVYVYTAEMFPTVVRNRAVGVCSLVARIGGIVARLLDFLKVYWLPFPVFIIGVVATTAGVCATLFPETVGQSLPDTFEEAIRIGDRNKGSEKRRCLASVCTCHQVDFKSYFQEELLEVPSSERTREKY